MEHAKYLKWHHQRNKARAKRLIAIFWSFATKNMYQISTEGWSPIQGFFFADLQQEQRWVMVNKDKRPSFDLSR